MSIYVGIDPGKHGAAALLYDDNSLDVFDIGEFYDDDGAANSSVNPILLDHFIRFKLKRRNNVHVCIERPIYVGGHSIQAAASMYESFGVMRCAFTLANIPLTDVPPTRWIKYYPNLHHPRKRREKIESVREVQRLFPEYGDLFERRIEKGRGKGNKIPLDGRAEAVLIANYARGQAHGIKAQV